MRLVDADKLHYHRVWIASIKDGVYNGMKSAVVVFADEIDKNKKARVDAADVAPVRHGRWTETEQPCGWCEVACAECSECGEDFVLGEYSMDDLRSLFRYCPNCGARMDGGADDEK